MENFMQWLTNGQHFLFVYMLHLYYSALEAFKFRCFLEDQ